jgi:hypothetical protein
MSVSVYLDDQHPVCKECHRSHKGYYSFKSWKGGYCPECGPNGSELLKSHRELQEFHGVPTGAISTSRKQEIINGE